MSTGISGLVDSLTPTVSGSEMYKKHPFSGADSGTEDSSHLEATHTTQNTLDNLLSNPLAFQAMEEATTLEDLCQNVSTVSRDCIISLPAQSPIYSRMSSMTRRSTAAAHMSPSPSPPNSGASPTNPPASGGYSPIVNPPTPPQAAAGSGTEDADSADLGFWRGGVGGVATGVPPSAERASASIWGGVPMRPVQRSLQELLAQGAHQCPLQPVFRLEKPPPSALVFTMSAGAATICNGTLELPRSSFLVCNEECVQLTLQDVTIRGAGVTIVCHGDGAEVRFQNVNFDGCSVIVLSGAKATLDNCNAVDANVFVVASGAHTQVHMSHGRVKACGQVAMVECGAELRMSEVKARSMCVGGVQASGFWHVFEFEPLRYF